MRTTGERGPDEGGGGGGNGRLLAGRYRVTGQLGRGGMGVVWRAMDEVLGREVALKELRTYTDAGGPELDDLRTRMRREARAAARVRHSGVIAVHDIAQHEGRPVIVMELVEGPSLDDVLRGRGPLGPVEAARIGASVLDALAAAHRVGVLHRDVKPGNILLEGGSTARAAEGEADGAGGRVVLTDFGIAAVEDPGDGSATRLTGSGELVGSLDYLAPERARGEDPGPASDVWALGATLYAAVEGASPFRRTSTWSTLNAIVVDPLPEPRRAGPLGPALAELMEKDPARRADAVRAAALLSAVASGRPLPTSPDTLRLGRRAPDPAPSGSGAGAGAGAPGGPAASGAGAPQGPAAHAAGASPPAPVRDGAAGGGRRRRIAVAAAVAAVVLAGAGVTYAVVGHGGGSGDRASATGGKGEAAAEGGTRGEAGGGSTPSPDGSAKDEAERDGGAGGAADGEGDAKKGKDENGSPDSGSGTDKGDDGAADGDSGKGGDEGSGGGEGDGASGGGGGGDTDPAPVCHDVGGGKYNCEVWKDAASYDSAHKPVGTLKAGVNYFYCQTKLSHRETYGKWTNVWWAKTDDDSGNAGVFVSAVYLKGGDNDKPLPGLPTC
ncbi:serine/threonine-protein kinase [Streptomyces sp. NPDC054796]